MRIRWLPTIFIFLLFGLIISCTWSYSRKFVSLKADKSEAIAGWTFTPDIQSYHYISKPGAPADSGDVWLQLTANHPRVPYRESLYGVDIDTVFIYYEDSATVKYTWVKQASAYGDPLEYKKLVCRFRFQDPEGSYHFYIPDRVDTLYIEFNANFYRGILSSSRPNTEYSTQYDTVITDSSVAEMFSERVRMRLIKKISKKPVPSFI